MSKIGYLEDDPEDVDAGPPSPDDDSDVKYLIFCLYFEICIHY